MGTAAAVPARFDDEAINVAQRQLVQTFHFRVAPQGAARPQWSFHELSQIFIHADDNRSRVCAWAHYKPVVVLFHSPQNLPEFGTEGLDAYDLSLESCGRHHAYLAASLTIPRGTGQPWGRRVFSSRIEARRTRSEFLCVVGFVLNDRFARHRLRKCLEHRETELLWIRRVLSDELLQQNVSAMAGLCVASPASPNAIRAARTAYVLSSRTLCKDQAHTGYRAQRGLPIPVSFLMLEEILQLRIREAEVQIIGERWESTPRLQ